ncbi:outer membrane protein [Sphingobium boeckii]|uniref:Outer membrane immunogenic protein n=1 Tax=Sphingobium boeckii TaxID=1082345 RepID=A0A7W9EDZ2_9SPHN|nr:porin family protein [Sphingobium boeckii]MBB5684141.1 outer membrane immunogenic protein [Sphingobium boeckii]
MRNLVLASLLATAFATPALAQDADAPFTGPRVEALVGWDRIQGDDSHSDDVGYGVAAGYDVQAGRAVIGAEVEYSDSDNRACAGATTVANPRLCLKSGRDLYVGGRVGTAITPSTLLYAKAGYTNAGAKFTSDDGVDEVTLDKSNLDGVRVGAGIEQKLGSKTYLKGEYRYSNYEAGVERHQAMAGVGIRF